jgi:hypothetical protein
MNIDIGLTLQAAGVILFLAIAFFRNTPDRQIFTDFSCIFRVLLLLLLLHQVPQNVVKDPAMIKVSQLHLQNTFFSKINTIGLALTAKLVG